MTVEEASNRAEKLFNSGYNCAQSVFATFADEIGIDLKIALKISQGFGGGMGRMREVCGTVSAMVMVISYLFGSDDASDKKSKDECYKAVQQVSDEFRKMNGSIICRELLGLVPMGQSEAALKNKEPIEHKVESSVSSERTLEYYKKRPCALLCRDAAGIVAEFLAQEKF